MAVTEVEAQRGSVEGRSRRRRVAVWRAWTWKAEVYRRRAVGATVDVSSKRNKADGPLKRMRIV
jgi:hypothetical protein